MYHNFNFQIREATLNASLSIQDFNELFEEFVIWPVDVSFCSIQIKYCHFNFANALFTVSEEISWQVQYFSTSQHC